MEYLRSNFFSTLAAIVFGIMISLAINKIVDDTDSIKRLELLSEPVLKNVELIDYMEVDKPKDAVKIHLIGEKVRNDCGSPQSLAGYYGKPLKRFERVSVVKRDNKLVNDNTGGYIERPAISGETQDFGWWLLEPAPVGPFYLYVDYICGQNQSSGINAPYPYRSVIGPFSVPIPMTETQTSETE